MGGTIAGTFYFYLVAVSHGLVALTLVYWVVRSFRNRQWLPNTPLDLPLAAFLAASLLSALLSADRRLSLENLLHLGLFVFIYYLAVQLMLGWKSPIPLVKVLLMNGAVVVLVGAIELGIRYRDLGRLLEVDWPSLWDFFGWLAGRRSVVTLGNANPLAWFLSIQIAIAVAQYRRTTSHWTRTNLLIFMAGAGGILLTTFSRSGTVGLLAALTALAVLSTAPGWNARWKNWPSKTWIRLSAAAGLGFLAGGGALAALVALRPRTVEIRLNLWQAAVSMIMDHPLMGGGPGTYGYQLHRLPIPFVEAQGLNFNNAHNVYLNLAAEGGVLTLAVGLWLTGAALAAGWRGWRLQNRAGRWTTAGALAGWVGLMVAGLFDVPWVFPFATVYLALLTAIMVFPLCQEGAVLGGWARSAPLALAACCILVMAWMDGAHYFQQRAVGAARQGAWEASLTDLDRALALDPFMSTYGFQRGKVLGILGLEGASPEHLEEALDAYLAEFDRGGDVSPNRTDAAWLAFGAGDTAEALTHMARAAALAPQEPQYHMGLGYLREAAGDEGGAVEAYAQAVFLSPSLARSAFWRTSFLRQEMRDRWPPAAGGGVDSRGERAYGRGELQEALAAYQGELGAPCPGRRPGYYYDSHVYHREELGVDYRPYDLRCAPRDDLVPHYVHMVDAYRRLGQEAEAEAIEDWLDHFYGDALQGDSLIR
jgi:putative inorganic carbon (HCO3(-)) transporter